jgi:hypothetical protein
LTSATEILQQVTNLRNSKVTDLSAIEIIKSIRDLINHCNVKFLKDPQVDVNYTKSNIIQTEIKSWYLPDLNLNNIHDRIINAFDNLKRNPNYTQIEISSRCIDAICILVDYVNGVILSRTEHYLELQEKKLDDCNSSKANETSTHLVNGDDFYG